MEIPVGIPFIVDEDRPISLTEQVANGFQSAISSGHYQQGDLLPPVRDTAATLGVSEIVVRNAVKRLSAAGVVVARPRRGIEVCDSERHVWQAHVLYLHWSGATSYYSSAQMNGLSRVLHRERVLTTPIYLGEGEARRDFPVLRTMLDSQPIALAMLVGVHDKVDVLLARRKVPFLHLSRDQGSPLAEHVLHIDDELCDDDVVRHVVDCGLRTALVVSMRASVPRLADKMAKSGLAVSHLMAPPDRTCGYPENVERGGFLALQAYLKDTPKVPDLIYFTDDIMARGAFLALSQAGLRAPEQVQIISTANAGAGPVYSRPLTRVEVDPATNGECLSTQVLAALKGRRRLPPLTLAPRFIPGETTVPLHRI